MFFMRRRISNIRKDFLITTVLHKLSMIFLLTISVLFDRTFVDVCTNIDTMDR